MDEDQLKKMESHITNAWTAGVITAVLTFISIVVSVINADFKVTYGNNLRMLIDLAVIIGLTYGIYRKNRFCALGMLIDFVVNTFTLAVTGKAIHIGIVSVILIYYFIQGTIAAFILHKSIKNENKGVKKNGKKIVAYTVSGVVVAVIIVLGTLSSLGPGTEVIPGEKLNKKYYSFIHDNKLIDPSEKIIYWYSDAFYDFKNRFYFYTDKRILIYNKKRKRPDISIPLSDVSFVEFQKEKPFFKDSRVIITLNDKSVLNIPVSNENNGDEMFFSKLKSIWKKQLWENQLRLQPANKNGGIFFKTMNQLWKTKLDNNLTGKK